MEIEERIYWEEEQKMNPKMVALVTILMSATNLGIIIFLFLQDDSKMELLVKLGISGFILVIATFAILMIRSQKLNMAITKLGFYFKMSPSFGQPTFIGWDTIKSVGITKSPMKGYGKHVKFKYGEVYVMHAGKGIELTFTNDKKKFFSCKEPDEFLKYVNKLELPIEIINV